MISLAPLTAPRDAAAPLLKSAVDAWPEDSGTCAHCGLAVPVARSTNDSPQFCCSGCETAYTVIHACGLDRFYQLLASGEATPTPAKASRRAYAEFDDPTFRSLYSRPVPNGLESIQLILEGVHCSACVWLVEKLPRVLTGVVEARLDIRRGIVEVVYAPSEVSLSRVGRTLDSLGYPAHPARSTSARDARRSADRVMMIRMAVAGACAGNIMLLFIALYAGMFQGMDAGHALLLRWAAAILNTICLAWPGAVFARGAIAALRTRTIQLDVPIAMGLYLGGAWGVWKTIAATWTSSVSGASDIYFDSISALVFFLLIGRFLQQRQQRSAADALEMLFSLTPGVARRVSATKGDASPGDVQDVPTEALVVGDVVEVRAGDSAPADGEVVSGNSSVDLSLLTGESRPVSIGPGASVAAGCVNLESTIRIRVHATGEATRIGKLLRVVEEAAQRRAAIVRIADKWGAWLLWALLALAAITLIIWWHAGPARAIDHAVALLIATCPCGLGLATPLAMTVSIGRAARRGILVKGGDALQSLATPRAGTVVLDKTGTITQGRLSLVEWIGDADAQPLAAALEAHSSHPTARAICNGLGAESTRLSRSVCDVSQVMGAGIQGAVSDRRVMIGTERFLSDRGITLPEPIAQAAAIARARGHSTTYVGVDGRCVAVATMGDPIRPDARSAIARIRERGWRVVILSGDHPEIVTAVGESVGVEPSMCYASATPEFKREVVEELLKRGLVVMVGDGVNDAAALATATVGIAVRGGAEASLAAADISMTAEGLAPLVELFDGARRTLRTIHWTIATSLAYNVLAASLSMAGLISPLLAAIIMPASSLTVVGVCLSSWAFQTSQRGVRA